MRPTAHGNVLRRAYRLARIVILPFCFVAGHMQAQQPVSATGAVGASDFAQTAANPASSTEPSTAPQPTDAAVSGTIADTAGAAISGAHVTLQGTEPDQVRTAISGSDGTFVFSSVAPGTYLVTVHASGFSPWKIRDVILLHKAENLGLPQIQLGVEAVNTTVTAITIEDLAEQQITAEEHQRILGILPNFYVSYLPDAAPLTRKQKFKLAVHVSVDPITFFKVSVASGIEQWQGDFSGYGDDFPGYAKRFGASYGDSLSSTFLGAALLPSLLHQDPRYFYRGHGHIIVRALYAISTTVVCKGDNGHWQPNVSNVFGNLGAAGISALYYPSSDHHSVQVTADNTLLGVAEGAFGTLFQEFLLHRFTHGVPPPNPN